MVCSVFEVTRSCYYAHRARRHRIDARRVTLRSQVNQLFSESRGAAGSRSILGMMREDGVVIGRFQVRSLMRELGLVSKQPGSHAYKQATVFFYGWKSRERAGRSMYVLTKTAISNRAFQGYSYAVMEFPVVFEESGLSLGFFLGDHPDPKLINCYEGVYLDDKRKVSCEYKNAGAIKKYFALQDSGGGD